MTNNTTSDNRVEAARIDAFVDAAFAFAVTLLVISMGNVPADVAELKAALKGIPAFAAGFALLTMFWWKHVTWRRRYDLRDGSSLLLSLLLVFLVLVYVYPLRMMFSSFFHWASGGWLSSGMVTQTESDLAVLFVIYHIAWTTLGLVLTGLYLHAWRLRESLGLDAEARAALRSQLATSAMIPATGVLALLCACLLAVLTARDFIPFTAIVYALMGLSGVAASRAARSFA